MTSQKMFNALGMVVKSHQYLYGQRMLENLSRGQVYLIVLTTDLGVSVKEKILNKAKFYHVKVIEDVLSMEQLTKLLHHETPIAAIGITDRNLAKLIELSL
jgi:ribosomal protein L7Ae-like RNA K-turn-binding protein